MGKRPITIGGNMMKESWWFVAIDGDEEVTLYENLPKLLEGKDFFIRHGSRLTACYPGNFPTSSKLRLTSTKRDFLKVVLKKTPAGNFSIKCDGKRHGPPPKSALCIYPT